MTTLENFYYGNIIPHEIPIIKGSEYDTANRFVVRHDEALTATLTEQQKETFQKFKDNYLFLIRSAHSPHIKSTHNHSSFSAVQGGTCYQTQRLFYAAE